VLKRKRNKKQKPVNAYARFTTVAFQMGATIYLGNLLGGWLDSKYDKNFLESTITLLAVFLAMYMVIAQVIKLSKDND